MVEGRHSLSAHQRTRAGMAVLTRTSCNIRVRTSFRRNERRWLCRRQAVYRHSGGENCDGSLSPVGAGPVEFGFGPLFALAFSDLVVWLLVSHKPVTRNRRTDLDKRAYELRLARADVPGHRKVTRR